MRKRFLLASIPILFFYLTARAATTNVSSDGSLDLGNSESGSINVFIAQRALVLLATIAFIFIIYNIIVRATTHDSTRSVKAGWRIIIGIVALFCILLAWAIVSFG